MAGKKPKRNEIAKPHDAAFKALFSQKNVAQDVIVNNLPPEIIKILELDSLVKIDGSFITKDLKEKFTDIIYQVRINKKDTYIALLLEHKSSPDKLTALQVARYIIEFWAKEIKQGKKEISIIIPIVIYHGKKEWKHSTDIRSLITNYDELPGYIKAKLPVLDHEFINIGTHEDKEFIKYEPITRMILRSMKYIFYGKDKIIEELLLSADELPEAFDEEELYYIVDVLFIYFQNTGDKITEQDLARKIREQGRKGEKIMTILQAREQKGREEGIVIGMEKGFIAGRRETAKNFLRMGISPEQVVEAAGLTLEEVFELKKEIEN